MIGMATATNMRTIRAGDRAQWRAWLRANCESAGEVWLVIQHVRSATPSVRHDDAIEEALSFGWIDSLARKHDAESWCQRFSPRNPRGAWSNVNKALVEHLTAQGLMTPHGQAAIDLAKRTGAWWLLTDAQNGVIPDDLREQLAANAVAAGDFDAFSPSTKRATLEWIAKAKRPETRQRRITQTVECAAVG